jgi:hypothetical protein
VIVCVRFSVFQSRLVLPSDCVRIEQHCWQGLDIYTTYIYIYISSPTHTHTHIYIYIYISSRCMYVCMYVCMYNIHAHTTSSKISADKYIRYKLTTICTHIHIHLYTYTYTYICTHIHMHIPTASSLMTEDKKCRPLIFFSEGPNQGTHEPFPIGPNVRKRTDGRTDARPDVRCDSRTDSRSDHSRSDTRSDRGDARCDSRMDAKHDRRGFDDKGSP